MEKKGIHFLDKQHEDFYRKNFFKCRRQDVYHSALIYCLGLTEDTLRYIEEIYDFMEGLVKPECLHRGWQTSGSIRVILLAFHLYNDGTPSVYEYDDPEDQLEECRRYLITELFCCGYAPCFWQAICLPKGRSRKDDGVCESGDWPGKKRKTGFAGEYRSTAN